MKILVIGDIVGKPGRDAVVALVPKLIAERGVSFVVANGENMAGGSGLTPDTAKELFAAGVDCITSGDHVYKHREIIPALNTDPRILRPANFAAAAAGKGFTVLKARTGERVGVINLLGRIFTKPVDDPFAAVDGALAKLAGECDLIVVDMHAEATSEKIAMGWHLDGKVTAVFGTHTHVQTADERVLPKGTAYITDLGMAGPHDSVLGRDKSRVLEALTTGMPTHFDVASGDVRMNGALIDADPATHRAVAIERVSLALPAKS
jgi:2',3'-cyclic-nucleotide 2'-phosphodiesterase